MKEEHIFTEDTDGIDHINAYSKGKTELGRFLSNFTKCKIKTDEGIFNSLEGYWYWLLTEDESLKILYGYRAKQLGKSLDKVNEDVDRDKFKKAIDYKLLTNRRLLISQDLWLDLEVPITHYYSYGGKPIRTRHSWIIAHLELRRKWFVANKGNSKYF